MKVFMVPHLTQLGKGESGIRRVVEGYFRHLPAFGVELVGPTDAYDLKAVHAGTAPDANICHSHGIYFTGEYSAASWEWKANQSVIETARTASEVTVPSKWVAEIFQRDMRFTPHVIPHGIDWEDWQDVEPAGGGYVLYNKNRSADIVDPTPMGALAARFPELPFLTTFAPDLAPPNVRVIGLKPHSAMKRIVAGAAVYLSVIKETFCLGVLEAMACGVPVLGFAHGGNLDLVQHGVTGYLAQVGNIDDLAQGLAWCLEHRKQLSENARESARRWTWEAACQLVASVYEKAMQPEPATAAVIIPTYNYADKVARAIQSALAQDYKQLEAVVVVDDGSQDQGMTERVVRQFAAVDPRVHYIRQDNRGVAHARNAGIASVNSRYIACLDADDAIEPTFLSACIKPLEADRKLGVAYTGLHWIKPDNSQGISPWPGDFNYDQQLQRQNQIPTCCVFRREMWARLGGYRQRYAPGGAGSEDAELWLRAGAYGWGAVRADARPLFVYSWKSGRVSGDPNYHETDWLGWHPWVEDKQHPFASLATPRRFSHPVRQYDEPAISVVIPVGPGHEQTVIDALDSLEAQTFRKWEVIVVWTSTEPYPHMAAYPYVRLLNAPKLGAGEARNRGAAIARAPFLVFLDADDWLYPKALERMMQVWEEHGEIIFTDYVGKATVDDPRRLAPNLQERLYSWDQKSQQAIIGYRSANFEPERAQRQPEDGQPYHWSLVTCLIPKAWHDQIGGFDEGMKTWEDVDYHWRMAMAGRCYYRVPEELVVYRFHTGQRRQLGLQEHTRLVEYLRAKYRSIDIVSCNCGGNGQGSASKKKSNTGVLSVVARSNGGSKMGDSDLVMILYTHPNRGRHRVIGTATRTDYGQRKSGEKFLVKQLDLRTQPHIFRPVEQVRMSVPSMPMPVPPAPSVLGAIPEPPEEAPPSFEPPEPGAAETETAAGLDLQALPGVSKTLAKKLKSKGIQTADDILALGPDGLIELGAAKSKAEIIIQSVRELQAMAAAAG